MIDRSLWIVWFLSAFIFSFTNHNSHSSFGWLIYCSVWRALSIFLMTELSLSLHHIAGTARLDKPPPWPWAGEATTPHSGRQPGRQTRTCLCWDLTRDSTPLSQKDARHSSHRTSTKTPPTTLSNDKVAISNILPIRIIWPLLSITSSQEISSFLSA